MANFWAGVGQGFSGGFKTGWETAAERDKLEEAAKREKDKLIASITASRTAAKSYGGDIEGAIPKSFGINTDEELAPPTVDQRLSNLSSASMKDLYTIDAGSKFVVDSLKKDKEKTDQRNEDEDKNNSAIYTDPLTGMVNYSKMPPSVRKLYESNPKRKSNLDFYSGNLFAELTTARKESIAENVDAADSLMGMIGTRTGEIIDITKLPEKTQNYFYSDLGVKNLSGLLGALDGYTARYGRPPTYNPLNVPALENATNDVANNQKILSSGEFNGKPLNENQKEQLKEAIKNGRRRIAFIEAQSSYSLSRINRDIKLYDEAEDKKGFVEKKRFTDAGNDTNSFLEKYTVRPFETAILPNGNPLYEEIYFNRRKYGDEEYLELKPVFRSWLSTFRETIPSFTKEGVPLDKDRYTGVDRSILYLPPTFEVGASAPAEVSGGVPEDVPPDKELFGKQGYSVENPNMISKLQRMEREKVLNRFGFKADGTRMEDTAPLPAVIEDARNIKGAASGPSRKSMITPEPKQPVVEEKVEEEPLIPPLPTPQEPSPFETDISDDTESIVRDIKTTEPKVVEEIKVEAEEVVPEAPPEISDIYALARSADDPASKEIIQNSVSKLTEDEVRAFRDAFKSKNEDEVIRILNLGYLRLKGK